MKAVIFDFNGVVVDDEHIHEEAFRVILSDKGSSLSHDNYILYFDCLKFFIVLHKP